MVSKVISVTAPVTADSIIATLVERRALGLKGKTLSFPAPLCDLDAAFALQQGMSAAWCQRQNDTVIGWKCSLPSADKRVVAPIFKSETHHFVTDNTANYPVAVWAPQQIARIEPELVFVFSSSLLAGQATLTHAEIDAALDKVHLGLELIGGRFEQPNECSFYELFADGLFNQGLVIGPQIDFDSLGLASELTIGLKCGTEPERIIMGHHQNNDAKAPLYWLVNFLHNQGVDIHAGDSIITGSYAGVLDVPLQEKVTVTYQGLTTLSLTFCKK